MTYDLIIVGCGTGGATAAISGAKAGLKVLVLDSKKKELIGKKTCGDAIHEEHVSFLRELGVPLDEYALGNKIDSLQIISPNGKHMLLVEDNGFVTHRYEFGQMLMKHAESLGAEIRAGVSVSGPMIEGDKVAGVKTAGGEIRAPVIIDASGISSIIRKNIPFPTDFPKNMPPESFCKAYREVVEIEGEFDMPHTIKILFNNNFSPEGYSWFFPISKNILNNGLGLRGTLDARKSYEQNFRSKFKIKNYIDRSTWAIPMIRPFNGFVDNGVILIGDAAFNVNPIDGAGIGYSIMAGAFAAQQAAKFISSPTKENLWPYNNLFMEKIGRKHAQSAVFARALSSLENSDIDFIFSSGLIAAEDIKKAYSGSFKLSPMEKIKKAAIGAPRLHVLKGLLKVVKFTHEAKENYAKYPHTPEGIGAWSANIEKFYAEITKAFTPAGLR